MKQEDRSALRNWEEYKEDIMRSTPVDKNMTRAEIERHRVQLEANPVEWIKFFFPKYAKYEFAPFHIRAINRLVNNPEWYEVLSWARELAKSTVVMFVVMYLTLTGKKFNVLLTAATVDAARRLLAPYRANLESNGRIKAYYGEQTNLGSWTESEFITRKGVAFRGIGIGSAPRGSRNEEIRPDIELFDDYDTDEAVNNPETVKKNWEFFEDAVYPTRSISEPTLIVWCGNIIAKDCCITRAGAKADHWDIVNIRDKDGKSTWQAKNKEEDIDRTLGKISTRAAQKEYFNNPVSEGKIFKNLKFGKIPPLKKFKYVVIYGDPAPGENKTAKKSSTKGVWVCGWLDEKLYVIKGFQAKELNSVFIDWYFTLNDYVGEKTTIYNFMENNKLQDPFFQQVFKPLVNKRKKDLGVQLIINPDEDKKTDKATRIESDLEPLDRDGQLIFNIDEKDNPHMDELITQFKLFELHLPYNADGPDCIQGAYKKLLQKLDELTMTRVPMTSITRRNKHRR
ncbi:hypothetical protein [Petrimonas sulfuriphila]|uniref:hypothetical protein n=1 Tax=Petrimonas sulfuriphila TaxID=285070 RepID=UPI003EBD28AB